jgi:hypothetical protein
MGRDILEQVLRGRLAAGSPIVSAASHIKGGIVSSLEEGLDGVIVTFAPSKTAGDRTGKVSETAIAMLMDTKRSVRVTVSCQTR